MRPLSVARVLEHEHAGIEEQSAVAVLGEGRSGRRRRPPRSPPTRAAR
jgi:hypothetical protein